MKNGARGRRSYGEPKLLHLLHGLDVGLALGFVGAGLLLASALGVALLVVALLLGDFIVGLHLFFLDCTGVAVAGLVLLFQLGLGDVLLALGVLLADVLGVVGHRLALRHRDLVVGLDLLLADVVLVVRQGGLRAGRAGDEAGGGGGQDEQVF